eukprot:1045470-Rhodomonas_salina.1
MMWAELTSGRVCMVAAAEAAAVSVGGECAGGQGLELQVQPAGAAGGCRGRRVVSSEEEEEEEDCVEEEDVDKERWRGGERRKRGRMG